MRDLTRQMEDAFIEKAKGTAETVVRNYLRQQDAPDHGWCGDDPDPEATAKSLAQAKP